MRQNNLLLSHDVSEPRTSVADHPEDKLTRGLADRMRKTIGAEEEEKK